MPLPWLAKAKALNSCHQDLTEHQKDWNDVTLHSLDSKTWPSQSNSDQIPGTLCIFAKAERTSFIGFDPLLLRSGDSDKVVAMSECPSFSRFDYCFFVVEIDEVQESKISMA